jgi:hypothetical protein
MKRLDTTSVILRQWLLESDFPLLAATLLDRFSASQTWSRLSLQVIFSGNSENLLLLARLYHFQIS